MYLNVLATFSAWRSLLQSNTRGVFKDVISTHMDTLNRCIRGLGGWRKAYQDLVIQNLTCDADIHYWPGKKPNCMKDDNISHYFIYTILPILRACAYKTTGNVSGSISKECKAPSGGSCE